MAKGMVRHTVWKKKAGERYIDYSLLFIVLFLVAFGLIMIYSTSYYEAYKDQGDASYFLVKQLQATILGLGAMVVVALIPYQIWKQFMTLAYIGPLILVCMVMIPQLGYSANGATRWIRVGGLTLQPAEVAKLGMIISFATIICKMGKAITTRKGFFLLFCLPAPICLAIWQITNNLSSAIIVYGIALVMLFVASPKYKFFIILGVLGLAAALAVVVLIKEMASVGDNFRFDRILAWLNPESYSGDEGFQTLQALYAIGSGGVLGKGLGHSVQKLGFLPEAQNDMIFSIICEELGLFGGIGIILMFLLLIWRCMIIAHNASDRYGALLVAGVMGHIAIQVILNIAVVTNSMPNTGISLPFISYGGTSVVFLLSEIGLVFSVARGIRLKDL